MNPIRCILFHRRHHYKLNRFGEQAMRCSKCGRNFELNAGWWFVILFLGVCIAAGLMGILL